MSIQGNLFDNHEDALPRSGGYKPYTPDPAEIRAKVRGLIDELRVAAQMPWSEDKLGFHRVVMPQTTNWLPPDERAALLREFEAEVARLTGA